MTLTPKKQRELLESFIVDNEDLEKLEAKLAQFNIFEAIGVVRQEIRHSNFLAFLLNPSQNHRLNDIFLKRFLKRVLLETDEPTDATYAKISPVDIDIADLTDAEVRREWQNIDILIHSPRNKLVCAIENKIDSGELSHQLEKYEKTVNRYYKDCRAILIYLTPEGSTPSKSNWRTYSHSKVLEIIDSICTSYKSTLGADVYTLMTHYSTLIRRHIVSDSEIAELCRKIYTKHKQTLDLIFEHRPDLQSEIAAAIKNLLNQGIDSKELFVNYWSKGYISFETKDWENKLPIHAIYFQFENLPGSLVMRMQIGPIENKDIRQRLFNLSQRTEHSIFIKKARLNTNYTTIYNQPILKPSDYENADIEDILKKVQVFWQDFIQNDFLAIEEIINTNIENIINGDISASP